MKFLVTKDLSHSRLLAYLMGAVVMALLLYLLMDVVLHAYVIGLDMTSIKSTLFGNMETFEEPMLIDSLLLQVHVDLFMTLFTLLILSSIYIRLYEKTFLMKMILHTLFLSGVAAPISLLAAYIWSEHFVYVWLGSFSLWHTVALLLSVLIFKRLNFK